ncbi:MAG: helix-turn-helix domain-containing protein [Syntrophobacteraceae bacterium]|nr:helix-turn-helix domain-containing protein [Syntrophobacteraceae bacterium]
MKSFNPDILERALPFAAPDFTLLAPGPFVVLFAQARMGDGWLAVGDTKPPMLTRMSCPGDFCLLGFVLDARGEGRINGHSLLPGMCMFATAGAEIYCRTAEHTKWAILYIPQDQAPSMGPHQDTADRPGDVEALRLFQPGEPHAGRLFHQIQKLWTLSLAGIATEDGISQMAQIRGDFFAAWANAATDVSPARRRVLFERNRLLRKADEYLRSHGKRSITMRELSRATGAGEGALRRAFEDILGLPPVSYLRLLRLNGIHQELMDASPEQATVESLRSAWGFKDRAKFARSYAALFGESPEETLRQRRAACPTQPLQ